MPQEEQDQGYDRSRPPPSLRLVYHYDLVNCPGKMAIGLQIDFPPNGATPPHRHSGASVMGFVVEGTTRNKMNDDPIKTHVKGESWYEGPGCHHKISENASQTEKLVLLATLVQDKEVWERDGLMALFVPDPEYKDVKIDFKG